MSLNEVQTFFIPISLCVLRLTTVQMKRGSGLSVRQGWKDKAKEIKEFLHHIFVQIFVSGSQKSKYMKMSARIIAASLSINTSDTAMFP